ncbi:MAG: cryptochrome/photolyase family protein [Candidatus Hodarchaeales archaeon]
MSTNNNSIFIFRRDLRMDDNSGLIKAVNTSKKVIPIFISDQNLLSNKNISSNSKQFLQESILDLYHQFARIKTKLFLFYGKPEIIVNNLLSNGGLNITKVVMNRDYTPYSKIRDDKIFEICKKYGSDAVFTTDLLLNEPEFIRKKDGNPYTFFTPFFTRSRDRIVNKPMKITKKNFYSTDLPSMISVDRVKEIMNFYNPDLSVNGGRANGLQLVEEIPSHTNYTKERDFLAIKGTTNLSPHLKFGTVSIREVYHVIKATDNFELLRQLYWRDLYVHIGFNFPHVFKWSFRIKYDKLDWKYDKESFKAWCNGNTGFPIVDAGMRQLNLTGWMHNRVRMIVASFLTKDLQINWQWGEKYFARKLVDFDIAVNNGNWQWDASTGCDPVPYFRIFNPWLQQKKFDPKCEYIKEYIPELRKIDPRTIHNLWKVFPRNLRNYPKPMINHNLTREKAKIMFKTV